MNFLVNPFRAPSRADAGWFSAGLASSFPNIESGDDDDGSLIRPRVCSSSSSSSSASPGASVGATRPACKVFHVPPPAPGLSSSQATEPPDTGPNPADLTDQVLVFQFRGKFHAIDHKCPHSSYPLSDGAPFDIEDFGIALSAGITCPKHGWSFDLFSGMADRGSYRLKMWEVQLRDAGGEQEVWVRRKQRMG
ncbi:hypothetical protein B0T26DRAFT_647570 [Lasiosphaeria miniovina]|uniref:Rieske domain-containing protein n=1 Tax=Lasiosphaeria miniovina TaxID=1954250 RepID=A0AA40AKX7_9PEZI|nr:uncharacterized protein B0T26DRAFT_647570 [Lasiosphaeria miniovina]KAK0717751.1 hypothetical protein B0T26DRAFT_647570 [Lasiosphaeria miniovina]